MHKENGYILSITPEDASPCFVSNEFWFGPKINSNGSDWKTAESFMTNGLKLFPDLKSAQEAKNEVITKIKVSHSDISHVRLTIAETPDDLELLKNKKNLVVIQTIPEPIRAHEIIGKSEEKAVTNGYIPGSFFCTNGRKPFDTYDDAEYAAREVRRQAQCRATIATLAIKKIR